MVNDTQGRFLEQVQSEQADWLLVKIIAERMTEKLAKKRKEGRGGWNTASCNNEDLMEMLRDHVEKGDMIDIINFAAMIHVRKEIWEGGA